MKKLSFPLTIITLLLVCLHSFSSQAQTITQPIEDYKTDLAFGLNVNTMSGLLGGINVKYARQRKSLQYSTLFLELVNIKHPKEDSRIGNSLGTGESFVPGKLNYLVFIRSHYGREWLLFRPNVEQGVQVNLVGSAGLTFGLEIPYYVEYVDGRNIFIEQYDPQVVPSINSIIRSRGIFGEGLGKAQYLYGGSVKLGLAFRFNAFRNTTIGLESGAMLDVMNRKTPMMVGGEDKQIYQSFYLTLFYAIQTR
jgi:hypothetical protein